LATLHRVSASKSWTSAALTLSKVRSISIFPLNEKDWKRSDYQYTSSPYFVSNLLLQTLQFSTTSWLLQQRFLHVFSPINIFDSEKSTNREKNCDKKVLHFPKQLESLSSTLNQKLWSDLKKKTKLPPCWISCF